MDLFFLFNSSSMNAIMHVFIKTHRLIPKMDLFWMYRNQYPNGRNTWTSYCFCTFCFISCSVLLTVVFIYIV